MVLSILLRVVFLGHGVCMHIFIFSKQWPKSFPKYLKFILWPAVNEGTGHSISSPTPFGLTKIILHCKFNLHSWWKSIFNVFVGMCISSLGQWLSKSKFSNGLSAFFLLILKSISFVGYRFWDCFIPFWGLHIHSLKVYFLWTVVLAFTIVFCAFC